MLSNPDFMRSILQSNPQLQRLQEENPELRQMIDSPNFVQEMSQMLRNPSLRQEMMRNQGFFILMM
jgi:ubiquilin